MKVENRNEIDELSISFCFKGKSENFVYEFLYYDKDKEVEFLKHYRETIKSVSIYEKRLANQTIDNLIFNKTEIFFQKMCTCFKTQIYFEQLFKNYTNTIYITYFLLIRNSLKFSFTQPYHHFYLTKNSELPYEAEPFLSEESFTIYETRELPSPYKSNCTNYKEIYKTCSGQLDCHQFCLFEEHLKQHKLILNQITYTVKKYGHYLKDKQLLTFNQTIKLDQKLDEKIDSYCWSKFKQKNCFTFSFFPIREKINDKELYECTIYLNNVQIKNELTFKVSAIEIFYNFSSLIYLYTGISFSFLLRKLNHLIKGISYRLIYSFGLILLQIFMILQIKSIFEVYEDNLRIPSMYTITAVELIPPGKLICFNKYNSCENSKPNSILLIFSFISLF